MTTIPRHLRRLSLACVLLATACMDDEPAPLEGPDPIGPALYRVTPDCGQCKTMTVYYEVGSPELELRASDFEGNFLAHTLATASPSHAAYLDMWINGLSLGEIALGEVPQGVPFDGTSIDLWLPNLALSYSEYYPPTGLTEFDHWLYTLVDDLSNCSTSEDVELAPGCEPLADFPR